MTKGLLVPCLVVAGIVLAASGCGRGDGMRAVTGTVTFDGQPVESGEIMFRSPDGTEGSAAGRITGGRYSLRSTPGVKRVEITARREIETAPAASGEPAIGFESYIPEKYNRQSELTVEVAQHGRNSFDFDLTP